MMLGQRQAALKEAQIKSDLLQIEKDKHDILIKSQDLKSQEIKKINLEVLEL